MKLRLTIPWKIGLGFGLFMLVVAVVFLLTRQTLQQNKSLNNEVKNVSAPSIEAIEDLNQSISYSRVLIKHWALTQSRPDDKERVELRQLMDQIIPYQRLVVDSISQKWNSVELDTKDSLFYEIDRLDIVYDQIRSALPDFESYNDPLIQMKVQYQFLEGESLDLINSKIDHYMQNLLDFQRSNLTNVTQNINALNDKLQMIVGNLSVFVLSFGLIIAIFVSRSITKPVSDLKKTLLYLGKGIYPKRTMKVSNDEIGDMAFAVNRLTDGLEKTKEFSNSVGKGDFSAAYQPLSEDDELGYALLKMRDDLAENERELEQKVVERTNEVVQKKEEIERQKEIVTELYKDLTDSINYAQRIQQSILPSDYQIREMFPNSFVFYRPRDIVSGDFYWFRSSGKKKLFAAVDCTGHGVPGAFMSLVGYNVLNQVTKVYTQPAQILNHLNRLSSEALRIEGQEGEISDGMDVAMVSIDESTHTLESAGAFNPCFIIRNNELIALIGDKMAIGGFKYGEKRFTNNSFPLEDGDMIYTFTDGYADQFGGDRNKKFMKKKFKALLLEISELPVEKQQSTLDERFVQWQKDNDQVDDILVIGIRYNKLVN